MAQVFISHASGDTDAATRVREWLRAAGHSVFLDVDLEAGMQPGDRWRDRLYEEIHRADAMVCLVSAAFAESPWCAAEVGIAGWAGVRILPVRLAGDIGHRLVPADTQWADLTGDPARARAGLLEALHRLEAVVGQAWSTGRSPYPGLRAFDAGLARVFFGRTSETTRLAARLRAPADPGGYGLLAVIGPSGCGKSSLVQAGLIPLLAADPDWLVLPPLIPDGDPAAALARLLAKQGRDRGLGWSGEQVSAAFAETGGVSELLAELLVDASASQLLIVVDQAEELLTRTQETGRRTFAALVHEAAAGPTRVVAALRSDYFDPLLELFAESGVPVGTFPLAPLAREVLPEVVTGPARKAGIGVGDDLVARLVADTGSGHALPLLAFVLEQLAVGVEPGGSLSLLRYEQLGGVHGALAGQAGAALAAARAATGRSEAAVLAGLLRLVTVDENGQAARRRVDRAALPDSVHAELDEFVTRKLLVSDTADGRPVVDIAHDHILTAWPPLAAAIGQAADSLRLRAAVEDAAADWDRRDRPAGYLWELDRATTARRSLDPADLTPSARAFLDASRHHGRRRRLRATAALVAALLLVTAGGVTALLQWRTAVDRGNTAEQARQAAVAEVLLTRADATRDTDVRAALRLGIAADHLATSPRSRANLIDTLADSSHLATDLTDETMSAGLSVAFVPKGSLVAAGGEDGSVALWDASNPAAPRRISKVAVSPNSSYPLAFSADGSLLAASHGGGVTLLNVTDPAAPQELPAVLAGFDMAFLGSRPFLAVRDVDGVSLWDLTSPAAPRRVSTLPVSGVVAATADGATLATGDENGVVTLWDLTDPDSPRPRGGPFNIRDDGISAMAFVRDGDALAVGFDDGTAALWDVTETSELRRVADLLPAGPPDRELPSVTAMTTTADGDLLMVGGHWVAATTLWDVAEPAAPRSLGELEGYGGSGTLSFSADGSAIAIGHGETSAVLVDLTEPSTTHRLGADIVAPDGYIFSSALRGDARILATGGEGAVLLWDVSNPNEPRRLGGPLSDTKGEVVSLAFSKDGRMLAASGRYGPVMLWDVADPAGRRKLASLEAAGWVYSLAFTDDGGTLAVGGTAGMELWDIDPADGPRRASGPLNGHTRSVSALAFAPDGRTLTTGSLDETVALWDITDLRAPRRLGELLRAHTDQVWAIAFSPDGRTLATGTYETTILWDVRHPADPQPIGDPLAGRTYTRSPIRFSPDGRTLATGGGITGGDITNEAVLLWDLTDRTSPRIVGILPEIRSGAAFNADGRVLATIDTNNAAVLWDVGSIQDYQRDIIGIACRRAGRGLDPGEWERYALDLPYRPTC